MLDRLQTKELRYYFKRVYFGDKIIKNDLIF